MLGACGLGLGVGLGKMVSIFNPKYVYLLTEMVKQKCILEQIFWAKMDPVKVV